MAQQLRLQTHISEVAGEPPRDPAVWPQWQFTHQSLLALGPSRSHKPKPPALTTVMQFPQSYFSSPHDPGASLGEGTAGMSSWVAQHQPADSSISRCFHSCEVIAVVGDLTPFPTARTAMQMDGSHSWGLSCQHFFFYAVPKERLRTCSLGVS